MEWLWQQPLLIYLWRWNQWLILKFLIFFLNSLLEQDMLGFSLAPSVIYFFLQPVFFSEEQECWCQSVKVTCYKHNWFLWRGKVSVEVAFLFYFFFVSAKWRTCRDCESDAWQSCSGRLAGFPFCSAGCGCLLFPLHRAETVLIKCFKYPCEMYDKKWCSGWFWYPKPDKRSGIHGEVEHCIEYSRYSSKIWS